MNYTWDVERLKKLKEEISIKLSKTSDPLLVTKYEQILYSVEYVLDCYQLYTSKNLIKKVVSSFDKESYLNILKDDRDIVRLFGMYASIIRNFSESFEEDIPYIDTSLQKISTSCDKIMSLTTSFYHQFKGVFSDTYDSIKTNFNKRLIFRNDGKIESSTFPIYNTDLIYYGIGINSDLQDYVSTIHEVSHGITSTLNRDIMYNYDKYCLNEVDSLFFEMVGTDYVGQQTKNERDAWNIKYETFIDYLEGARVICSKMDSMNELGFINLGNKRKAKKFYKDNYNYDNSEIKKIMSTYIHDYFHYIVSYLIAIELYFMYKVDSKLALDVLQKIILLKNMDPQEYLNEVLSLGITPGKHTKDYYTLLLLEKEEIDEKKRL